MRMKYKHIAISVVLLCLVGWGLFDLLYKPSTVKNTAVKPTVVNTTAQSPASTVQTNEATEGRVSTSFWMNRTISAIRSQTHNLNPEVLKAGITAYNKAEKMGINQKHVLTIVDYSLPSTERRLWVIDMKNLKVLFNTWVAHGTNSGGATPSSFSNKPSSLKSSLGVFITDAPYTGHKGYSLRIKGMEHNINDNAYNRSIVFHGAWYVSSSFAEARGMMGRSWGCFAVDNKVIKALINTIKEKSVVVAYYPDKNWLRHSNFIN